MAQEDGRDLGSGDLWRGTAREGEESLPQDILSLPETCTDIKAELSSVERLGSSQVVFQESCGLAFPPGLG